MTKGNKTEQISVWRPNDVAGIELRSGTAVKEPYPRHWHEEYQFCFIQAGGGELFYRGVHHDTPQTSLFIVHPGEVHSNQTKIGCSRSEERRVGKECRSRWSPDYVKKRVKV